MQVDAQNLQKKVEALEGLFGTVIPTVTVIGNLVRLVAKSVRPSDAKKAQAFDEALADAKTKLAALDASLSDYQRIRAEVVGQAGTSDASGAADVASGPLDSAGG